MEKILKEIQLLIDKVLSEIMTQIPNIVLAIVVFLAGLILAYISRKLIKKFIHYLHIILNEKIKDKQLRVNLDDSAKFVATAFFWIIMLFTITLIAQILKFSFFTKWFEGLIIYLPNVGAAILIGFVGVIAGRLVNELISSKVSRTGISNRKNLGKLIQYFIVAVSIIIAIGQLGINIAFLTTIISIVVGGLLFGAALAFGLGAKTSVSNILGSYYVKKTYEVGNTIQVGETEGVITKITSTSVTIETKTDQVVVPTKEFNKKTIIIKNN